MELGNLGAESRMAELLRLRDVFTPGGQPSVTYVGREHLKLEDAVEDALERGYAINVVTGPTKSGKTVLCNRVLAKLGNSVAIEGGQVRSESDFWEQIAHKLNLTGSATKTVSDGDGLATKAGGTVGIKLVAQGGIDVTHSTSNQRTSSATVTNIPILASLKSLTDGRTSLLVDDFHYIPQAVQKAIIQSLKGAVFNGLSVILLAVPHRAFDPITVEDELQGRFRHIEIPSWSMDDLLKIPRLGFEALNIDCPAATQKRICEEGFGNPLLVQEICSELCGRNKIYERPEVRIKIDVSLLEESFAEIAKSKGFPKYRKLKEGPEAHKARQGRAFKVGPPQDIYSAIMTAVSKLGPKPRTTYDEIRGALRELLVETAMPAKHEITAALSNMSKIARDKIEGEPPLEWVRGEDALVITDPFLLFYMKWAAEQVAPGS